MLRWGLSTVRRLGGSDVSRLPRPCPALSHAHACNTRYVEGLSRADVSNTMKRADEQPPLTMSSTLVPAFPEFHTGVHPTIEAYVDVPPSRQKPPSIRLLRQFLSPANLASPTPIVYPARTLRALYLRAASHGALNELSSARFSTLIALFGTLSGDRVPDSGNACDVELACKMETRDWRPWWGFILQILRDKKALGKDLDAGDLYWLMRARLGEARVEGVEVDVDADASNSLSKARETYMHVKVRITDADTHLPYLRTLLSLQRPSATAEAAGWVCSLLGMWQHGSSRVLDLLWVVLMTGGEALPDTTKARMLDLISRRMTMPADILDAESPPGGMNGEPAVDDKAIELDPSFSISATDLTRQITTILFPRTSVSRIGTPSQLAIRSWALQQARTLFSPEIDPTFRWRNLALLALANSHSSVLTSENASSLQVPAGRRSSTVNFNIVAVLTVLERISRVHAVGPELHSFVRTLWRIWSDVVQEDRTVHAALVRPVLASFFLLAARTGDDALRIRALRLANTGFWAFDVGDDVARRQVQLLAVEYIVASAACGNTMWEDIVGVLPHYVAFPQWQAMLTGETVVRLSRINAGLALDMYTLWGRYMHIPHEVRGPLSLALVHDGQVELAMPLLAESSLAGKTGHDLLASVLLRLARERNWYVDLKLAGILSRALFEWSASPVSFPPAMRGRVSWALLAFVNSAHSSSVLPIFRNIWSRQPKYFAPHVVGILLRALLYHRQFRSASLLVESISSTYPAMAARWRRSLFYNLSRNGAGALVARTSLRLSDQSLSTPLARSTHFGRFKPSIAVGLRIQRHLNRPAGPAGEPSSGLRQALQVLTHTRGVGAAKKVLRRVAPLRDAATQTALGNVLLHNHAMLAKERNERNVRGVMRSMDYLVNECGFVPDRVTTNILVKTVLRWPQFLNSAQVRALFDHLIWTGYATGSIAAVGRFPFGSPIEVAASPASMLNGFVLPVPSTRPSFARHVRPLYKMFIKAFFVRGDVLAARTVVGILKDVESADLVRRVGRAARSSR